MPKVHKDEKEVITQKIRGAEDRATQGNLDPNRQGGNRDSRLSYGNLSGGITGEDWTWTVVSRQLIVTGGIITRLIRQAEQRLKEHDDRIIWYQEQKQKELEELEELKNLQRLVLETQGDTEKEPSEISDE